VESCTAIVEHDDGRFEILTWTGPLSKPQPVAPSLSAQAA
jgi:hypothetical protein